jgi:hypothetical protein
LDVAVAVDVELPALLGGFGFDAGLDVGRVGPVLAHIAA